MQIKTIFSITIVKEENYCGNSIKHSIKITEPKDVEILFSEGLDIRGGKENPILYTKSPNIFNDGVEITIEGIFIDEKTSIEDKNYTIKF